MNQKYLFSLLVVFSLAACVTGPNASSQKSPDSARTDSSPQIQIQVGKESRTFTRAELLKSPETKVITVTNDPSYPGRTMTYRAIPVAILFLGLEVDPKKTLVFSCLDGFSAPISSSRLLNRDAKGSIAYLAIEEPGVAWPPLKKSGDKTAGPFYLVWMNPEKSKIGPEEWPFQLSGFELKASLEEQYPLAVPSSKSSHAAKDGYRLFMKNCFACHTMNGQGTSQIGPDLNTPHNPTEYLKPEYLVKLIRNPQSLRHWPQAKMQGFDKSALSDEDIGKIVAYLKQMAKQK